MVKWNEIFTKKNKKKSKRCKIHDIPYGKFKVEVVLDIKTQKRIDTTPCSGEGFIPNHIEILKCTECVFGNTGHSAYFFPKTTSVKELIKNLEDLIKQEN